jgi:hypothetical protein
MTSMRRIAVVATALLLGPAAAAEAGGFATSGLSSLPDGLRAGEPWRVDVTVLAHGRTPAVGLKPQIVLTGPEGSRRAFPARPTGRAGVYHATVTFPAAGRWRYALDDGYGTGQRTTFPPVRIVAASGTVAAGGGGDGDGPAWWWVAAAALATVAAAAAAVTARSRRHAAT